jgi:hypothetical protein
VTALAMKKRDLLSTIAAKLLRLFRKLALGKDESVYEEVRYCDLCGGETFRRLQRFRSREWDNTAAFYKKYPADNPFVHIHKKHNLAQCEKCGLVFVTPRIKDWVVNRWYDEYLSGKYREFIVEYSQSGRENNFYNILNLLENSYKGGGGICLI